MPCALVNKANPCCLIQEVRVLSRVRHPNIVRFYGGCIRPPVVFIVEELMQSDLSELIHNNDLLPLDDVLRWGGG
jgi:serine/threonine protein kinase